MPCQRHTTPLRCEALDHDVAMSDLKRATLTQHALNPRTLLAPPAPASRACAEAPLTPPSPPVRSFSSPLSDVSATPPPILSVALLPVAEAAGLPPEGSQLQARNSKRLELLATIHYHSLPRTTSRLLPARRAAEPASSGGRVPTTWPLTRSSAAAAARSGPRGVGSVATRCVPWLACYGLTALTTHH